MPSPKPAISAPNPPGEIGDGHACAIGDRFHARLRIHHRAGERTTAIAQAFICCFLTIYHVAQAGPDGNTAVALGLVAILASSIVRFVLSSRPRLPERALDLMTAFDVLVFLALIWGYQSAYGHPAGGSLKAPSLAMLFVLIGLRVLRPDPRQVVIAGGTAIAGWAAVVALAVLQDGPAALAKDYLGYLSSYQILIGAEIERIIALAFLAGVLAVAARGAHRLLSQAAHVDDYQMALSAAHAHLATADAARTETQAALESLQRRDGELQRQNGHFGAALDNMSHGLCLLDAQRQLVVCNPRLLEIYKLPEGLAVPGVPIANIVAHGRNCGIYAGVHDDTPVDLLAGLAPASREGGSVVELADGRTIVIRARPMADGGLVVTHEDVTELRRSEARVAHMALHDTLTGLPNRRRFHDHLVDTMRLARQADGAVVLMVLDLDRFKEVNDALGDLAGDTLLKLVGRRLTSLVAPHLVARLGADEFAIVVPTSRTLAQQLATDLAETIAREIARPFQIDGRLTMVGASIGIARAPDDTIDAEDLIKKADLALAGSKGDENANFRFFEAEMDERQRRRRRLASDLQQAVVRDELDLHYQPQLDLASGRISGFEALLRWRHPDLGAVPPGEFIPIAEETGLIRTLGAWALRRACRDAAHWPADVGLAVNVSAIEFSPALVDTVIAILSETGFAPERLVLEVTETVVIEDAAGALAILGSLNDFGVRVALDDFGTGYASLSYLRMFPFDKIKIDRSFVSDLGSDRRGALAIIRCITHLADSLGMETTAEGIETIEQLESLRAEGCTEIQGYLLSPPRPAADVERLLKSGLPGSACASAA